TNKLRVTNNDVLKIYLKEAIGKFEREPLLQKLSDGSVPAGAIRTMDDVFVEPAAEPMILQGVVDGEDIRSVRAVSFSPPNQMSLQAVSPPPHLDQHRDEVLKLLS
ncbi:MAG: CoA transferase, partial [Chloroflexota bacterium]